MLRPVLTVLAAFVVASTALLGGSLAGKEPASSEGFVPLGAQIWKAHAHEFGPTHPLPPSDMVTDPIVAAKRLLSEEEFNGRTVVDWVDLASANRWLALPAPAQRDADLVRDVVRISQMVGVDPDVAAIEASAAAMPAELRAPFAALVAEVAHAYELQLAIAADVLPRTTVDDGVREWLTAAERDAMITSAERIVGAFNGFRAAVGTAPASATPIFSDPEGLVVLGGAGSDTWMRSGTIKDPVVLVDLGGDDTYLNSAGGASPTSVLQEDSNLLVLSFVADLAGNDQYRYVGLPSAVQGGASGGAIGILVDVQGDDIYFSHMTRTTRSAFFNYVDGGASGFGQAGLGLQIDGLGNDVFDTRVESATGRSIWAFGQGWGGAGGLGISADAHGDDQWLAYGVAQPCNPQCGFIGVYTNGAGFYGGVGIMSDTGFGNDVYLAYDNGTTTDYYAQGFGAFAGTGIMFEDGGDDDYTAVEIAQNPFIVPLLNCAFGTGSLGGAGFFLELGGNDRYYGASGSPRKGYVMNEGFGGIGAGYGMFVDVSGDDKHFMENLDQHGNPKPLNALGVAPDGSDTFGRGVILEHSSPLSGINTSGDGGANRFGHYLDLGGIDTYVGARPSRDGGSEIGGVAAWSGGMDANLPSETILGLFP